MHMMVVETSIAIKMKRCKEQASYLAAGKGDVQALFRPCRKTGKPVNAIIKLNVQHSEYLTRNLNGAALFTLN